MGFARVWQKALIILTKQSNTALYVWEMNRLLILIFLLFSSLSFYGQTNYLYIKRGYHKVRKYTEGDRIHFLLKDGHEIRGTISLLQNDTIYLNDKPIPREEVAAVILHERTKKPFPADFKTMLLIGAGAGLTYVGLTLNHANESKEVLIAVAVIGYGPLLIKHFAGRLIYAIHRKKFKFKKKFHLQVYDLRVPARRGF